MPRSITIVITTPEGYDTEPLRHRIEEVLEAIRGNDSEEVVSDDMKCEALEYSIAW